jgi:tetratricopeptide (TPR) repeat protein
LVRLTGKGAFARIKGVRRASFDALLHRDLDAFAGSYFHRSLAREAVSHAPLEIAQTPYWPAPAKGFDTGALEEGIDAMRLLYSKAAYVQALATGAEVLSALLRFPPDAFPAARGPWARFLVEWDRAGSWVGIDGVVPSETDTLWACRERLRVLSLMGRTREAYAAAGGIASALYRRGKAAGALYWLDIAHRDPESARTAGACSTRASMLMSVGEWQEAEALLKRSLDAWARQGSPVSLVKDVAKFGFIEAKWRKSRRGAARIDEALGMGPTGHPGFLAQVLGLKVQAAIALGDRDAATSGAQRFVRVCREHHLWHQLSGLRRPLDELGLTPTQRS